MIPEHTKKYQIIMIGNLLVFIIIMERAGYEKEMYQVGADDQAGG